MKKSLLLLSFTLLLSKTFAAEWPVSEVTKESYKSYFGQNRGGIISTSIVFTNPEEVKAYEDGKLIALIQEDSDDSDFFPSSLGTTVILMHNDNLISVYGNLEQESLDEIAIENLHAGDNIAITGNSGWQKDRSSLEFQILDSKKNTAVNPRILLSRQKDELPIYISNVTLMNKNKKTYELNTVRNFQSGLYKIYQKRNPVASPYKTAILVNGVLTDQITYDSVLEEDSDLKLIGKRKYSSEEVYPNQNLQLVGETMLTPGKISLTIVNTDILNQDKQITYYININ